MQNTVLGVTTAMKKNKARWKDRRSNWRDTGAKTGRSGGLSEVGTSVQTHEVRA